MDEEAATVAREIYSLAVKGHGPKEIAMTLQERRIEKPPCCMTMHGIWNCSSMFPLERPYDWNLRTVAWVEYLGHTVNGRLISESYQTPKRIRNDPSEWQIIENTHECCPYVNTIEPLQKARKCGIPIRKETNNFFGYYKMQQIPPATLDVAKIFINPFSDFHDIRQTRPNCHRSMNKLSQSCNKAIRMAVFPPFLSMI